MINRNRLADLFKFLAEIDSISKEEGRIAKELENILSSLGASVTFDDAGEKVNGEVGNLVARLEGNADVPPILLSGHMDTVKPGKGVKAILKDGVFTSDGTTILGADDKSALAIIIETIRVLTENNLPFGPLEIVFTICEEIGLLGAKNMDFSLITAKSGYILDSTDRDGIVTRSPTAYKFRINIHGKDAHAGAAPEKGVNAISVAAHAISKLEIGRIDHETTCNIGKIQGGMATNVVPSLVTIEGEARSMNPLKVEKVMANVLNTFKETVESFRKNSPDTHLPALDIATELEFPGTDIPDNHPVVKLAQQASKNLGHALKPVTIGGGADANIFFGKGIITGVLCPGMTDPHTVRESVKVDDMVFAVRQLLEIIRIHAKEEDY
ncbi:MAG: M20/M25/M40 family metallo-hydrolase [Proteobacteria bacterium]|nr:M20/M25/M40 family metallo-hydrolase [Pseudomonadota bacterium]